MFQKACLGLLCAGALLASPVFAAAPQAFKAGTTIDIELPPGIMKSFDNPAFWPVEGTCKVSTEDESDDLYVYMKERSGSVNDGEKDIPLKRGESATITVRNTQTFKLRAEAGAEVQVTNKGVSTVKGHCVAK